MDITDNTGVVYETILEEGLCSPEEVASITGLDIYDVNDAILGLEEYGMVQYIGDNMFIAFKP